MFCIFIFVRKFIMNNDLIKLILSVMYKVITFLILNLMENGTSNLYIMMIINLIYFDFLEAFSGSIL